MRACTLLVILLTATASPGEFRTDLSKGGKEAVLFPFDRDSIPLRKGLEMTLLRSHSTRAERACQTSRPARTSCVPAPVRAPSP